MRWKGTVTFELLNRENDYPLVITIVGAESSGKTVLAKQMAEALSCTWVPEYAREYLENLDRPYEFQDLEVIARRQWEMMANIHPSPLNSPFPPSPLNSPLPPSPLNSPLPPSPLKGVNENYTIDSFNSLNSFVDYIKSLKREVIIVDAGLLTIRMWARIKYGRTIPFIEEAMKTDPTSFYLLCRPRMQWESDPLREAPSLVDRVWIYNQYLKEILERRIHYHIITT